MEYLSNIELYFASSVNGNNLIISAEERDHIIKVMRHSTGDKLYVTDGEGKIFLSEIVDVRKEFLSAGIKEIMKYDNHYENIFFCIPKLRNPERFEFALEKSTELGIVNFIIYNSHRGFKKGEKRERWEKIVVSAMKQSLRCYKPKLFYIDELSELNNSEEGMKIILEQNASEYLNIEKIIKNKKCYFIFGPEGGLDDIEIKGINNSLFVKISPNRLRTETAVIKTASILTV